MADLDLARRAVAATGWSPGWHDWVPTMHPLPWRGPDGVLWRLVRSDDHAYEVPDLDDPATVGCLLALVRERWGDPEIWMMRHPHWTARGWVTGWQVVAGHRYEELRRSDRHRGTTLAEGPTEAAALVIALEAAP